MKKKKNAHSFRNENSKYFTRGLSDFENIGNYAFQKTPSVIVFVSGEVNLHVKSNLILSRVTDIRDNDRYYSVTSIMKIIWINLVVKGIIEAEFMLEMESVMKV